MKASSQGYLHLPIPNDLDSLSDTALRLSDLVQHSNCPMGENLEKLLFLISFSSNGSTPNLWVKNDRRKSHHRPDYHPGPCTAARGSRRCHGENPLLSGERAFEEADLKMPLESWKTELGRQTWFFASIIRKSLIPHSQPQSLRAKWVVQAYTTVLAVKILLVFSKGNSK